ncbi:MAG: ribose-5-phosphate isomerase RpiA [Thermomicrobiales bacterium]
MDSNERLVRLGERAAAEVAAGSVVGLGTGSTAEAMIRALGARVAEGLAVTGVATSNRTIALAESLGIPLVALDDVDRIDLCIDGADEIDLEVNVVKGKGGALLFEKLVARQAHRYLIIASGEKLVSRLGTRLPLPVEVIPLGWKATARAVAALGLAPTRRANDDGSPYVTDGGHWILDCDPPEQGFADPAALAEALKAIVGVVEHGLFIGMADLALTIDETGAITETVRSGA